MWGLILGDGIGLRENKKDEVKYCIYIDDDGYGRKDRK